MIPAAPDLDRWQAWTPAEAARILEGVRAPWFVVGGWALDLWHGQETREHEDLEIAFPRPRFEAFREALHDFALFDAGSGRLRYLPPDAAPSPDDHQTWVLDTREDVWRMDLMREPGDDATWVCRRDDSIRLPRSEVSARSADGIAYLLPQFVLLFKAKAVRPKDEADLAAALPRLSSPARAWLSDALASIHPGHPWIETLREHT